MHVALRKFGDNLTRVILVLAIFVLNNSGDWVVGGMLLLLCFL